MELFISHREMKKKNPHPNWKAQPLSGQLEGHSIVTEKTSRKLHSFVPIFMNLLIIIIIIFLK